MAGKIAKCPNGKVPARCRDDGGQRAARVTFAR
jgi:hypothetical protein